MSSDKYSIYLLKIMSRQKTLKLKKKKPQDIISPVSLLAQTIETTCNSAFISLLIKEIICNGIEIDYVLY